jgi:hypothetical protein
MFEVREGDKLMIQGQGRYWIYNKNQDIIMCSVKEVNLLSPITLEIKENGFFKIEEGGIANLLRTRP